MSLDVMRVRLHLRQVRVLEVVADTRFELVVEVCLAARRPRCPECGYACLRVHDNDVRVKRVRDLEASGWSVLLLWHRHRLVCDDCGIRFLEQHPALEGAITARLTRRIVADARGMRLFSMKLGPGVL